MSRKSKNHSCEALPRKSGSRDAVESAIDLAKGDKRITWEASARAAKKISRWESLVVSKHQTKTKSAA